MEGNLRKRWSGKIAKIIATYWPGVSDFIVISGLDPKLYFGDLSSKTLSAFGTSYTFGAVIKVFMNTILIKWFLILVKLIAKF